MADTARIDELRRRVQKDPASIAFSQLAEEYRRAGRFVEAIDICRTGLAYHPSYLSARVTLGRALIEIGQLDLAREELARVHAAAPENLAAIKGLAEIHRARGERDEALALYSRAVELAPHDPELEHLIGALRAPEMKSAPASADPVPGAGAPGTVSADDTALAEAFEAGIPLNAPARMPEPPADPEAKTPGQIEALERWLEAILADRAARG